MSGQVSTSRWASAISTNLLLSTVPAFTVGLAAFLLAAALEAPAGPLVGTAFAVAFVGTLWRFPPRPAVDHLHEAAPSGEAGGRLLPICLLALAVPLSMLITFPKLDEFGTRMLGNTGDAGLNVYLLEWQLHALRDGLSEYFEPNIFSPEKFTLFWGPALIPLVPIYAFARAVTGDLIATFNLLMVVVSFLTLLSTYLFSRQAGFGPGAAGLAGVLYATTGQRMAHLSHLDSFQTLWIPVFGYLVLRLWEKRRARYGAMLGIALGTSLLSAPYYFLAGIGFLLAVVSVHIRRWRELPWTGLAWSGAVTLAIGTPILVMSKLAGLARSREELLPVSWADFYHPGFYAPAMEWLANAASAEGGGRSLENWLFPSLPLAILGSVGAWTWLAARGASGCPLPPRHPPVLPALIGAAASSGILMGVGPYLDVAGLRLPLPMAAMLRIPGFEAARVTGRFLSTAMLALTVLALIGAGRLTARLDRVRGSVVLGALAVACLATTSTVPPTVAFDASGRPAEVNRALAERSEGLVVELPWSSCPGIDCLFTEPPRMIWSRFDWFPRLGGYSGYIPLYWRAAGQMLAGFPDERSLEYLADHGASYVILRVSAGEQGSHLLPDDAARIAAKAASSPEVGSVEKFGDDYLVTLLPAVNRQGAVDDRGQRRGRTRQMSPSSPTT